MSIYRDGNSFSDTGGGEDITEHLSRLVPKQRGKGRLVPPPTREGLPASVAEVLPNDTTPGGSIASPLTEQAPSDTSTYSMTSSDGLFVYEFYQQTDYLDANGDGLVVEHRDPAL